MGRLRGYAEDLRERGLREKRLVFVSGLMGIGKSWLLQYLVNELEEAGEGYFCLYMDLKDFSEEYEGDPVAAVSEVIDEIAAKVAKWLGKEHGGEKAEGAPPLDVRAEWLKIDVEELLKKKEPAVLILCIDHIDQVPWELLEILEDRILVPLLSIPRVLIVLAGRRRRYPWRYEDVRKRYELMELGRFAEEDSKKQIQRLRELGIEIKREWDEIETLGEPYSELRGYPWGNYLLATVEELEEALERAKEVLLHDLESEYHQMVEEVSIFDSFDEDRITKVLGINGKRARALIDRLTALGYAWWEGDKYGYVMDPRLRKLLEASLREQDLDRWKELHSRAKKMYAEWFENGDFWAQQRDYHAGKLKELENKTS